ncbi:hypothetical protein [Bacteroides caecicola]|uniref:hypothetical protein n=1 Tax=Bacteroides caecicola TaxID=1462569 RepID=UPI002011099C|nr:hypothetical protein [Bacteroides caecicola]MCL1625430.1 hypothetical protein [Bacteroides caecicola]
MMNRSTILVMLLCLFTLVGCKDNETAIVYETNDDLLNRNNITDVVMVFQRIEQEGETLYYGNRKGKDWFALFDNTGTLQDEWYGKDRYYQGPQISVVFPTEFEFFKKLENGMYAFVYDFRPEDIRQAVYLCNNQNVEYGFVLDDDMSIRAILDKDRFLINEEVYDFAGNILVNDVRYSDGICVGFQNDKVWVGFEDKEKGWREVVGAESFERNRTVHLGYDKYEDIYVGTIYVGSSIVTDFGLAFVPRYDISSYSHNSDGVFIINKDKLIFYSCQMGMNALLRNWWNGTILADNKYVISQEGESLAELKKEPSDEDIIISLTEGLRIGYYDNFELVNYEEGTVTWSTDIPQLAEADNGARITITILEKNASIWKINFKVVNRDGSQFSFDISIDIESGELQ